MKWQTIDTAPKDRNILLWDGATVSEGGWLTESDQTGEPECGAMSPGWWSTHGADGNPTHWMPMPDFPMIDEERRCADCGASVRYTARGCVVIGRDPEPQREGHGE